MTFSLLPFSFLHFAFRICDRRKSTIFFLILGICLIALAVALNVGWILLNLREVALLVFGIIFFALIITGLILNTIFLAARNPPQRTARRFFKCRHARTENADRFDQTLSRNLENTRVTEEKRREFYDVMLADSNRLLTTVEQVLQASRARAEKNRLLNISEINLGKLLRRMHRNRADALQTRRNDDQIYRTGGRNVKISGDAAELQTVFINLLDNAVKIFGRRAENFRADEKFGR